MKPPSELAKKLSRQWHDSSIRQHRLLSNQAWPLELPIGKPSAKRWREKPGDIRLHLQRWRDVSVGTVVWQPTQYRDLSDGVDIPYCWRIDNPTEWVAACGVTQIEEEFSHFAKVVKLTNPLFHELILQQRIQVLARSVEEVVQVAEVAMSLQPGCAQGKPLRALAIAGCDTKIFERNRRLLQQMLELRFGDIVLQQGLERFLGAMDEHDHWLLVVPLDKDLMSFSQQRVRARELMATPLPGSRILVIENERCVHQLPQQNDTVAILGAGLNLGWLAADWLRYREVAYWGDIDTWGLKMLARAREQLCNIQPLMMSRAVFDNHELRAAVSEPVHAGDKPPEPLTEEEQMLYRYLLARKKGRLEQEFLPVTLASEIVTKWGD
ncbi:MAG: Wadjet anti-phage system protein JetD domain-containing protein [Pseudomonadales bacterium]